MYRTPSVLPPDDTLRLGVSLPPHADVAALRALATAADSAGLELVGLPDHPYNPQHLDVLAVIADLLAHTSRITLFTDVANLPLRPPSVLAKTSATLDRLSGGRFALGLGAGQAWEQIDAIGGPVRRPAEALAAFAEAVAVIRAMWATDAAAQHLPGEHYRLAGVRPGPAPASGVDIWVGALFPRMLALTGRIGDGWAAPIQTYLPHERWLPAQDAVDRGALEAGRDPRTVRRIAQVVGTVADVAGPVWTAQGGAPVRTTPRGWADLVARLVEEFRFDDVVFWPERATADQVGRFAHDVAPLARDRVASIAAVPAP